MGYNTTMSELDELRNIIRQKPYLIWYTRKYDQLSLKAISEAIFNYGSWEDFKSAEEVLGIKNFSQVFSELKTQKRSNLHPLVSNYFALYFNKYA